MRFTCLAVATAVLGQPKKTSGDEHHFLCPRHNDHNPSLKINDRKDVWLCKPCGGEGTPWALGAFLAGLDPSDKENVIAWLQEHNLMDGGAIAEYIYRDADNKPALKVLRYEGKGFSQQMWNGHSWDGEAKKPKLLYRLPDLLAKPERLVVLCEGEKDTDRLRSLGFLATTNPCGAEAAGKWQDSYTKVLMGHPVAIFTDNDAPGRSHAVKKAAALLTAGCEVRMVDLPGLKEKEDVSDWLNAGHPTEELKECIRKTQPLDKTALTELERKSQKELEELKRKSRKGKSATKNRALVTSEIPDATPDLLSQGFHDAGNAERLIALHGHNLRYYHDSNKWLVFNGLRWIRDTDGTSEKRAKETILTFWKQAVAKSKEVAEKFARSSLNYGRIKNMLALAQCERPITTKDLDSHPFLLNCRNGTLDLKTGKLREHRREDYLTKLVHFEYNQKTECPQFMRFLYEIMGLTPDSSEGEQKRIDQLVEYLQKVFGYASTGDVSEKKVFCFFGSGDNGKTTLLEAIRHVLAEYSHQLLIDSLMARTGRETNASLADLADLRGARFVTTSEGESGQRLAEAKLKYLTAGMGEIKTCRKYENPIMFPATHKLFVDSNYKPHIRGTDNAIWSRLRPIPFAVTIPPKQINKELLTELKCEGEGILAWLVKGCAEWQRDGLPDPQEVSKSAKTWRAENNPIQDFIEDVCVFDKANKRLFCSTAALSHAYRQWAQNNSEKDVLTTMEFGDLLEHMGCKRSKRDISGKQKRVWVGIGFKETRKTVVEKERREDDGHSTPH
ncbi:phage/plasmid primase, P4 family [Acidobacteria bacterium AH-259-A15]|nr:phage/plasmid primase, P4 family [Acidobacteria bacterium AH-259-A15]